MNDETKVALNALLAERNTWARQERDEANARAREASNERDLLALKVEDLEP